MAAIEIGWYLDAGAVVWDAGEGRFGLVYEKMPAAVESLAKQVSVIQLTGDFAAADALIKKYVKKEKENTYSLTTGLAAVRDKVIEKFKAAGIKSPSLRYDIKGL